MDVESREHSTSNNCQKSSDVQKWRITEGWMSILNIPCKDHVWTVLFLLNTSLGESILKSLKTLFLPSELLKYLRLFFEYYQWCKWTYHALSKLHKGDKYSAVGLWLNRRTKLLLEEITFMRNDSYMEEDYSSMQRYLI